MTTPVDIATSADLLAYLDGRPPSAANFVASALRYGPKVSDPDVFKSQILDYFDRRVASDEGAPSNPFLIADHRSRLEQFVG